MAFLAGVTGHPVAAAFSAVAMLGGGYATAAAVSAGPTPVVVTSVVDGDTIRVSRAGEEFKVRLLNIDTPESVDPAKPVECLAPEATAFLRQRLPVGTAVQLEYDREREDRYGRDLAGVFVDGSLVNAEIARAGLGGAVVYDGNDRFYDEVLAAQRQATLNGVGLHSAEVACTLPAQILAFENKSAAAGRAPAPTTDLAAFDARGQELTTLMAEGSALLALVQQTRGGFPVAAYTAESRDSQRARVQAAVTFTAGLRQSNDASRSTEVERQRIAAEEAARTAAQEQARRESEEAARRQAAEDARAATRKPSPSASDDAPQDDGPQPSTSGSDEPWNSPGPDLDCPDIGRRVFITGPDYHGLDRDGDGVGCESYG